MPTPSDVVSIQLAGREHRHWMHYRIDSDLLTPADAWSVSLSPPRTLPDQVEPGRQVLVKVGGEPVLQGLIDEVEDEVAAESRSLSLSGRDGAAVLVDCSAPVFVSRLVGLQEVVSSIVQPLGVTKVRIDGNTRGLAEKVNVEPGDTAWDALVKSAEANGLWPWFEPDGTLVVGGPNYARPPVGRLVMRKDGRGNNIKRLVRHRSIAKRYSHITVLGQQHGTDTYEGRHALKHTAQDGGVQVYRPRIQIDHDAETTEAVKARSRKLIADGQLDGLTLTAVVKGHRTADGVLWTPGQRVHVYSEPHGIDGIYFLMARSFTGGSEVPTETTLTLKDDGVWVLDAHPHKRRSKTKTAGEVVDLS